MESTLAEAQHITSQHPQGSRSSRTLGGSDGFTLMELLIVIAVLLVVTIVAIPNLGGFRVQANENSAIASLRSIYQSEIKYSATYPSHGFACSLGTLGGKPGAGKASADQAQVLPNDLASGQKSGYRFTIAHCPKDTSRDHDQYIDFEVTAVPQTPGKSGHRGFCVDRQGEITVDPAGGTNCTLALP